MIFSMGTVGTMDRNYAIDVIAHPTNIWNLGEPGSSCQGYTSNRLISGSTCVLQSYPGASSTVANGFRIVIDSPAAVDINNNQFQIRLPNPTQAVNMAWVAQSARDANADAGKYPKSVILDHPIHVTSAPLGELVEWEIEAVSAEQWVTLEMLPGNTIEPFRPSRETTRTHAGSIRIIPPSGFYVRLLYRFIEFIRITPLTFRLFSFLYQ